MAAGLLVLAVAALVAFGFLGVGRGGGIYGFDMRYIHVAGEMWDNLQTPYDAADFKAHMKSIADFDSEIFAYPPNSAPLAMVLSIGDLDYARLAMGALNIASILFLVLFLCNGALKAGAIDAADQARMRADILFASAVVIGNPFTAHVVWMGQTTLVAAALLMGCWLLADRRRDILAGVLLGLSAFKPQLALLVGFWFLLDRRWSLLVAAAATTLAATAWPIIAAGIEGSWIAWIRSLGEYSDSEFNTATFRHVFGLRSVLASAGLETPSLMPLAAASVFLLYLMREGYESIWLIAAILIISALLFMAHDYDLAPAAVITYPLLRAARGRRTLLATLAVLACILFFPQRIWERLDLGVLARSRELALLALLAIYLVICRNPLGSAAALQTGRSA
ncbi:glycosyltransferase family 87 protein [Paracoccus sp. (in: a-proteobacteria)]